MIGDGDRESNQSYGKRNKDSANPVRGDTEVIYPDPAGGIRNPAISIGGVVTE